MKKHLKTATAIITLAVILLVGCEKPEGEGGLATIRGRVLVKDYNSTFTQLLDTYYAQDEEVYIIYGEDKAVGDRVRTSYDGWFEFAFLRPGKYKVYAYSKDSTLQTLAKIPVIRDVVITTRKEVVETEEIVVFN